MNDRKQPVKVAVKAFYASRQLSDVQQQLLDELQQPQQQTIENTRSNNFFTRPWVGSIAASLLLFIVIFSYAYTPAVITAAYADTLQDAKLNNGMQVSMNQWMIDNRINGVPEEYPVEMSKFCNIDQYQTTHLRIAGVEQGVLHIFMHSGAISGVWGKYTGTIDEMNWKLIKIRDEMTLIVLYSNDMRDSAVQNILDEMLPELQA